MTIIGIAGTHASGKDTVGEYLRDKYNFYFEVTSDLVREEAMKRRGSVDRPVLVEVANQMREEGGTGVLCEEIIKRYETLKDKYPAGLAIGGIRALGEVEAIHKAGGTMVFVDAPVDMRYQRLASRGRVDDAIDLAEFKRREEVELRGETSKVGQNILGVKEQSDVILVNDGTLAEFHAKIDRLLEDFS